MPRKRARSQSKTRAKRPSANDREAVSAGIEAGRDQADEVFARRARTRRKRAAVVKRHAAARKRGGRAAAIAETVLARNSVGTLVAEGDSWFDYPFYDVLKLLEDDYGYDVVTVAHRGDAVEIMAYGGGQLDDFARRLEQVLRSGTAPRAILLSGGGNDVAGDAFAMLLNHKLSPRPGLNAGVLDGVLRQRMRPAYATILSAVTRLCVKYVGQPLPILVHGYGYPVPDGRGFWGGFSALPGPWLEPGFREKGYDNLGERIAIARDLIDGFNEMVAGLVALSEFRHVRYVDVRPLLSSDPRDYRKWWGNELHPTERGFRAVTAKFADELSKVV